jgi:hypothetical protein
MGSMLSLGTLEPAAAGVFSTPESYNAAVLVVSAPWTVAPVQLREQRSKGSDVVVGGDYYYRYRLLCVAK